MAGAALQDLTVRGSRIDLASFSFSRLASREIMTLVAYDEDLASRVRELIALEPSLTEKRMFGGLSFLIGGHMSVSVSGQGGLLLRVDPDETESLLGKPFAQPLVMRGREMNGWLRVEAEGVRTKAQLQRWVARGVTYARSLPAKH